MITSASLALLGAGAALASPVLSRNALQRRVTNTPVIIQMFEWNWNSIGEECGYFIGPAGYSYVQVSTAQETIQGDQWWTSYQPVSYKIQGKRGSRDEFRNMVTKCNNAGVQVLVDVVFNHMVGIDGGTGNAGSGFSHYNYNGIYNPDDFHYCGTDGNDIQNWGDRWQIQTCELANLADLKTESERVRSQLVNHANDLLSLGVAGFRIDAAKHMPVGDLQNILSRLSRQVFVTSEVVGDGAPISASEYAGIGQVSITRSFEVLRDAFNGQDLTSLKGYEAKSTVASESATVFVATHDSERGNTGGSLNYKSPNNAYTLANIFNLAYPYGTPTVLSSYDFNNGDQGAPNGGYGTCYGGGGTNGYLCQHRWTPIAEMVKFRTAVGNAGLQNWQSGNNNQIAFDRGNAGFVAINYNGGSWNANLSTALPDGTYCDAISGGKNGNGCVGQQIQVSGGRVSVNVPGYNAVAIHSGTRL
jgi:hypothetical protein